MNFLENKEIPKEIQEISPIPEIPNQTAEFSSLKDVWNEFTSSISEFAETVKDAFDSTDDATIEAREYGLEAGIEVVKECFPPEVIESWGYMDLEQRNVILQEYAQGIGEALGINIQNIVWEYMEPGIGGYNNGDGNVYMNVELLADPAYLMTLIDTIAHEARHQLQKEAIANPGDFPFDDETINEWMVAEAIYTTNYPTAYDPWGYKYNPMEIDSRSYGEGVVRGYTKDMINNA